MIMQFAVAVIKGDETVVLKHVSRAVSLYNYLSKSLEEFWICEVTGSSVNCGVGLGVEIPCKYMLYGMSTLCRLQTPLLQLHFALTVNNYYASMLSGLHSSGR